MRKNETALFFYAKTSTVCVQILMVFFLLVLKAKKEIVEVKSQRLCLAQDEYNHLSNALGTLTTSRTSRKNATQAQLQARLKYIFLFQCVQVPAALVQNTIQIF
jgi:hypothetical protein